MWYQSLLIPCLYVFNVQSGKSVYFKSRMMFARITPDSLQEFSIHSGWMAMKPLILPSSKLDTQNLPWICLLQLWCNPAPKLPTYKRNIYIIFGAHILASAHQKYLAPWVSITRQWSKATFLLLLGQNRHLHSPSTSNAREIYYCAICLESQSLNLEHRKVTLRNSALSLDQRWYRLLSLNITKWLKSNATFRFYPDCTKAVPRPLKFVSWVKLSEFLAVYTHRVPQRAQAQSTLS